MKFLGKFFTNIMESLGIVCQEMTRIINFLEEWIAWKQLLQHAESFGQWDDFVTAHKRKLRVSKVNCIGVA